ncbi:ATP-dependent protease La [Phascolomyces articulosus]|uniref:Lon protease homolog n=1 Tax=Phascolomyces articulosus TaxID=60185 RepID=A0AAD5JUZ4_9FUNG|nr:ATP-dependent protease La [Phascolomyces articulosus]
MPSLSESLIVVPLEKKVLLPSVVIKVTLRGREATLLVRKHFKQQEYQRSPLHLACIPVKPLPSISKSKNTSSTSPSKIDDISQPPQEAGSALIPQPTGTTAVTNNKDQGEKLVPNQMKPLLFNYGCTGRIVRVQRLGTGAYGIFLEGLSRCKIGSYDQEEGSGLVTAKVNYVSNVTEQQAKGDMIKFLALAREFVNKMRDLQIPQSLVEQLAGLLDTQPVPIMADMLVCMIETTFEEKLSLLATEDVRQRLNKASKWMTRQLHVLKISDEIHSAVEGNLTKKQREFYLKQQLEAIRKELNQGNGANSGATGNVNSGLGSATGRGNSQDIEEDDMAHLNRRLAEAKLPNEALTVAQRELKRIQRLQPSSTEWAVARNYLEVLADLPWSKQTRDILDIARAKKQLDHDHFGLAHVKKRIVEYLSVAKLKGDLKAPILCFVGPPGVGKTSLGRSIAMSLGRRFHRISLGGVRDEADMRGHRRTYVGAMPGLIIQGVRRCGVNNPVFLLDEVDKLVHSSHYGDPAAALLEVLDPEQNNTFSDHYLNVPFDLSKIMFIATANSLDTIPAPLLDRMEVIQLHGYTFEEKLHIARTHLLPKQIQQHGLSPDKIRVDDQTLLWLAEQYTRESGVRTLERTIASVIRSKCVQLANLLEEGKEDRYSPVIVLKDIPDMLGVPPFEKETIEREPFPGVATGLAYSSSGNGGILFIESSRMPGKGDLRLTGSLGDVIKESAHIALTWVKSNAYALKIAPNADTNIVEKYDIHIHMPQGSVPKEGPSAGVTLVTSLVSLFTGCVVSSTTAMTGEISLRGHVLPVGGIKEKVISAHRAGVRKIVLPERNRKDVDADVPESVKSDIRFVYAKTIWDVLEATIVMADKTVWRPMESHL